MGPLTLLSIAAAAALGAPAALAHVETAQGPVGQGGVSMQWTFEPWVAVLLAVAWGLYALGVTRLWQRAGPRRGLNSAHLAAFGLGWVTLVIALMSPLDALGSKFFSAHMAQHELLMLVAAPLLVIARPLAAWSWALPAGATRVFGRIFRSTPWSGFWSVITDPISAWALHALALWVWHVPRLFDAALANEGVHALQHSSFLLSALLFWWSVLGRDSRAREGVGIALLSIFTTMLHTGALGALLALSPTPWYPAASEATTALGFDPVADQQLGGLIMWVPGSIAYLAAGLILAGRLLAPQPGRPASATHPVPPHPGAQ